MNIIFTIFNNLLDSLFKATGDWGIAIILLTLIVRTILLPISLKQRVNSEKHIIFMQKMEEIKKKYKHNKNDLETEMKKLYKENVSLGANFILLIIQIPIMFALGKVFIKMAMQVGTIIVPWVTSLQFSDPYFIIPIVATFIQLLPSILYQLGIIKNTGGVKFTMKNMILPTIINIMILIKLPIAIAIYFVASTLYTTIELIGYEIYLSMKKKHTIIS